MLSRLRVHTGVFRVYLAAIRRRTLPTRRSDLVVPCAGRLSFLTSNPVAQRKHEPGSPMNLANMRRQGVRNLIAFCLNDACRHTAVIEVWSYPPETEIAYFRNRVVCAKYGARRHKIDVRPTGRKHRAQLMTGAGMKRCRVVSDGWLIRPNSPGASAA